MKTKQLATTVAAGLIALLLLPAPSTSTGLDTRLGPIDPSAELTVPMAAGLAPIDWLVVQDNVPWFTDSVGRALNAAGQGWTRVTAAELLATDLTQFNGIITVSDQQSGYYDGLAAAKPLLEQYVALGGTLVANMAQAGWHSNPVNGATWLPACASFKIRHSNSATIEDPTSPLVAGMSNSHVQNWNYVTHGYLTDLPATHSVVVSSGGNPILVTYPYGLGTVHATMMTTEWAWGRYGGNGGGQLLQNEIDAPHTPALGIDNLVGALSSGCAAP